MGNKNSNENPRTRSNNTQIATAKLQDLNANLEKRYALLEKRIADETEKARSFLKEGKKEQAALCLKRRKQFELEKGRIHSNIANNEEIIAKFDEAILNNEVLNAQKLGAKELKNIHKGVKIDDIDEQISNIQDAMAEANEISIALSQPLGVTEDFDDDMAALQEELDKEEMEGVEVGATKLPKTKAKVAEKEVEEEEEEEENEELAKLKMELA